MAVVRKTILPSSGKLHSPDGEYVASTEKNRKFVKTFAKLTKQGIKFGVPWSHLSDEFGNSSAVPNSKEFLTSKFNSGYIKNLLLGPNGELQADLDCPGLAADADGNLAGKAELPDGTKVDTVISEVSPWIMPKWTDGKGQTHSDVIGHVALTTLPVVGDQPGFIALSTKKAAKGFYLSTTTDDTDSDTELLADDIDAVTTDEDKDAADIETFLEATDTPAGNPAQERLTRVMGMMATGGVPLPPDTTVDNFMERFEVALGVLIEKMKAKAVEVPEPSDESEPAITPESPPATSMMMSTIRAIRSNPVTLQFALDAIKQRRVDRGRRIEKLRQRGLPGEVADDLAGRKIRLATSLTPKGKLGDDETDRTIGILEKVLPRDEFRDIYLSTMTPANVEVHGNAASHSEPSESIGNLRVTKEEKSFIEETVSRSHGKV